MENKAIYVFAIWQVKEGQLDSVLSSLESAAHSSRREPGNLFYNLHQDNADANRIILYEGYADQAALDEHRNSLHFQTIVIGQIVPNLEKREVIVSSAVG